MATFKERLIRAMELRQMSAAELSRFSKVNDGAISQYRKGVYKASQPTIERLAKCLNVSIPWLMGAVDTFGPFETVSKNITDPEQQLLADFRKLNAAGQTAAAAAVKGFTQMEQYVKKEYQITSA